MENYLSHHGIKGQKWGVRRFQNKDGSLTADGKKRRTPYRSTSIGAAVARRSNEKIDKSFRNWDENTKKKDNAIELGKKATASKIAYEKDRNNSQLKSEYKKANADYKKALKENTTYRKGVVRQEVGRDASRKYLSEAKKVEKQLAKDPDNKVLKKQYSDLMSKHDTERANARRAVEVSTKRMNKSRAIKSTMTKTVKAAATTAAVAAGTMAVNKYLNDHQVTFNGKRVNLGATTINDATKFAKTVQNTMGYFY